ncbi:MAG: hypothetical protein SF053_21960 [Bacteroidia bacterium]|nr:hypothetical protein [Bacteroidia bacterium]
MKKRLLLCLIWAGCMLPIYAQLTVSGYTNHDLHGFNILVNNDLPVSHTLITQNALTLLDSMLAEITRMGLETDILDSLRQVPIFMEWAVTNGSAWYHYDLNWLIQNGFIPQKHRAVEIANVTHFYNWARQNQPYMILHELAHGYHDRVLGLTYAPIIQAYDQAMAAGIYNSVLYNPGNGGNLFSLPAYAKNDNREYFAELTEAYLGNKNDYFPFDSTDLQQHDPAGYAAVRTIWRLTGTTGLNDFFQPVHALQAWPNPALAEVHIQLPEGNTVDKVLIINTLGEKVGEYGPATTRLSIGDLPPGLYTLTATDTRQHNYYTHLLKIR